MSEVVRVPGCTRTRGRCFAVLEGEDARGEAVRGDERRRVDELAGQATVRQLSPSMDTTRQQRLVASAIDVTTKTKDKDVVVDRAMRSNDVNGHAVRHRPSGRWWPVWPLDHATA
jgi:hypothetical protein